MPQSTSDLCHMPTQWGQADFSFFVSFFVKLKIQFLGIFPEDSDLCWHEGKGKRSGAGISVGLNNESSPTC